MPKEISIINYNGESYDIVDATASSKYASKEHAHGNIMNNGTMTATAAIQSGDKLVIVDANASPANKIVGSLSFDASTTTKALTPNGTWEPFLPLTGGTLTGRLTMSGGKPINQILTGTGTAGRDAGSGDNRYQPARWTFNAGSAAVDGDIYTIKVPVAGHDYGTFMSVDNGSNYYPVVVSGTGRVTTHYAVNNYIQVIFEPTGSAASMFPLAGGTSRVTVSGGVFRVLNYYDSGNSGLYQNYNPKAYKVGSTAIVAYDLVAEDANGLLVPARAVAHRVGSPIYVSNSALNANATGSWISLYMRHYSQLIRNNGSNLATTSYKPLYLKGTIANGLFTPDTSAPFVLSYEGCNVTGAYYMYIGDATTSASYISFNDYHPYYYYDGTNLVLYTERAGAVDWSNILNKPGSITPSSHSHGIITNSGYAGTSSGMALYTATDGIIVANTLPIVAGGTGASTGSQAANNLLSSLPT